MSTMPSQKTGTEMPAEASTMAPRSRREPGRSAAATPRPTPSTVAISIAARARRRVWGKVVAIASRTGSRET